MINRRRRPQPVDQLRSRSPNTRGHRTDAVEVWSVVMRAGPGIRWDRAHSSWHPTVGGSLLDRVAGRLERAERGRLPEVEAVYGAAGLMSGRRRIRNELASPRSAARAG